ncbi:MAG TPA: protein translocase subunit SecD [Actinomycetota bacterium]
MASIVFVAVVVSTAVGGFIANVRPVLGLDLVGGVSVVLSGPSGTSKDVMQKALDRIRDRVDALGVAEPDISLVGNNIQVQLPGLGGQGKVEKRGGEFCAISSTDKELGCFKTQAAAQAKAKAQSVARVLQLIGTTARLEQRQVLNILAPSAAGYKTTPLTKYNPPATDGHELVTYLDTNGNGKFDNGVEAKYVLGKIILTGGALTKASALYIAAGTQGLSATVTPGWRVTFQLDKQGAAIFGNITTKLAPLPQGDPKKQIAIVLDDVIQSAPAIQSPITGGSGEITGNFTESQAKNLAVVLNSGALPVQLTRQEVVTVSPTLGKQSLRQGIVAGLVGLVVLMLYLAFYYRLLGIVTWLGMGIWAVLAIGLVSLLGRTAGYALTLAGVAGIIVSLGITADSYIVFYERLKDEVRHGKTLRSAVVPAFKRSWRTIVAADIVTATAAAVLYVLAVGSVKGFALTLGLSTGLDLFVVYFFKRPTVFLISRSPLLSNLRGVGLRSGVAADPVPVAGGER